MLLTLGERTEIGMQIAMGAGSEQKNSPIENWVEFLEIYFALAFSIVQNNHDGSVIRGSVPGRLESEDLKTGLDEELDDLFMRLLKMYQRKHEDFKTRVYSEHGTRGSRQPQYLCALDPFDGSGLHRRGLRKEWYSVATIFGLDGTPLVGGAVNFRERELYIATPSGVTRRSLWGDNCFYEPVFPNTTTQINTEMVMSAYFMNRDYRYEWDRRMKSFQEQHNIFVWGNGGSCIYPLLASGEVDAYVMFDEPRSEIDPGLAFARAAGLTVLTVNEDGSSQPYRFEPGTQAERIRFFVVACTLKLAQEIIQNVTYD